MTTQQIDSLCINTIRTLAMDAVQQARSGHPDCGTSGGVFGLERGYCLMIGGEPDVVHHLDPIFATLSPGPGKFDRTRGREARPGTAERVTCTAVRTAPATS